VTSPDWLIAITIVPWKGPVPAPGASKVVIVAHELGENALQTSTTRIAPNVMFSFFILGFSFVVLAFFNFPS
jgi:hypothetical protein